MNSSLFFNMSLVAYLVASVVYITYLAFRNERIGQAGTYITFFGFIVQTVALGIRWYEKASLMGFGHRDFA